MANCTPFIGVPDIAQTIAWYESIGFTCTGTNHIWEPDCALNWAELDFRGARFMLLPYPLPIPSGPRYVGLYFELDSLDGLAEMLQGKAEIIEITDETFYGRKEIVFRDVNGFQVTFSCEP